MRREFYLLFVVFTLGVSSISFAQEGKISFSLEQAKEYAKENSYLLKNSKADIEAAKKKVWETTAIGLPQASANFAYSYMLEVPEASAQFAGLGAMIGSFGKRITDLEDKSNGITPTPESPSSSGSASVNDLKWGATMDVKVTQLIFSGAYLVGLQASKTYRNITEYLDNKNLDDVMESVVNSYVLVLIAKENRIILESTLNNLKSTLADITALHKEGFVEDTDVDQLQLTVNLIENSLSMLDRQLILAERLLKFQIGMDMGTELVLTDNLDNLIVTSNLETMSNMTFDVNSSINYKLVENQEKISHLGLKLSKTEFLPTIAAFYNHNENFNNKSFNMTPSDILGLSLSIPIFSSGQRYSKLGQAKIAYEQAQTNKIKASQGLLLDYEQSKTNYLSSLDNYKNYRKSLKLSEKIFDKTSIKFKEGVSSSLDLTQTQNQYLKTQSDYYQSVLDLFKNKTKLDKIIKRY